MDMEEVEYLEEYEDVMMCYGTPASNTSFGNTLPSFQSTFDRFSRSSTGELIGVWDSKTGIQTIPPPRFCNPSSSTVSAGTSIVSGASKQINESILSNDDFDQWIEEVSDTASPSPVKRKIPWSSPKEIIVKDIKLPAPPMQSSAVIRQQQSNMNKSKLGLNTSKSISPKKEKTLSITEKIGKLIKPRIDSQNKVVKPNQKPQLQSNKNTFLDKLKKIQNSEQIRNEIIALKKNLYTSKTPTNSHNGKKEKLPTRNFKPPTNYSSESFQRPVDKRYHHSQNLESRLTPKQHTERRDLIKEKNNAFRLKPRTAYEKKFNHDDIQAELEYIRRNYYKQRDDSDQSDSDIIQKMPVKAYNKVAKVQHHHNTDLQYIRRKPQKPIDSDYNNVNDNLDHQRKKFQTYFQTKEKKRQDQTNQTSPVVIQSKSKPIIEKKKLSPEIPDVRTELVLIRGSPNSDIESEAQSPEAKKLMDREKPTTSFNKNYYEDKKFNIKNIQAKRRKFLLEDDLDSEYFSSSSESEGNQIAIQKSAKTKNQRNIEHRDIKTEPDLTWEEPKSRFKTYKEKLKLYDSNVESKSNWQKPKPKFEEMLEENVKNAPSRRDKELNILKPKTVIDNKDDDNMKAVFHINATNSQKIVDEPEAKTTIQNNNPEKVEPPKSLNDNSFEKTNQQQKKHHNVTDDSQAIQEVMVNDVRKDAKTNVESKPVRRRKLILKKRTKPTRAIRRVFTKTLLRNLAEKVLRNENGEENNISKYKLDEEKPEKNFEIETNKMISADTFDLPQVDDNVEDHDIFKELQFECEKEPEEVIHQTDKQAKTANDVNIQPILEELEKPLKVSESTELKPSDKSKLEVSSGTKSEVIAGNELKVSAEKKLEISPGNNFEVGPCKLKSNSGNKLKDSAVNKLKKLEASAGDKLDISAANKFEAITTQKLEFNSEAKLKDTAGNNLEPSPPAKLKVNPEKKFKATAGNKLDAFTGNKLQVSAAAKLQDRVSHNLESSAPTKFKVNPEKKFKARAGNKLDVITGDKLEGSAAAKFEERIGRHNLESSARTKLEVSAGTKLEVSTVTDTENSGQSKIEISSRRENIDAPNQIVPKRKKKKMNTIGPKQKQIDKKSLPKMKKLKVRLNKKEVERYLIKQDLTKMTPAKIENAKSQTKIQNKTNNPALPSDVTKKYEVNLKSEKANVLTEPKTTQKKVSARMITSTPLFKRKSAKTSIPNSLNAENSVPTTSANSRILQNDTSTFKTTTLSKKYKSQNDLSFPIGTNMLTQKKESNQEINKPTSKRLKPIASEDSNQVNATFKRITKRRQSAPPEIEVQAKNVTVSSIKLEAELKRQKIADALSAISNVPLLSSTILSPPKPETSKTNEKMFIQTPNVKEEIAARTNKIPEQNNVMPLDTNITNSDSIKKVITCCTIPSHLVVETRLLTKDAYRKKKLSSLGGTSRETIAPATKSNITAESIIGRCVDLLNTNITKEANQQARRMNVGSVKTSDRLGFRRKLNVNRVNQQFEIDTKTALTFYNFLSEYFNANTTDSTPVIKVSSNEQNQFVLHNTTITKTTTGNNISLTKRPVQSIQQKIKNLTDNKVIASFTPPVTAKSSGYNNVNQTVNRSLSPRVCYSGKKSTYTFKKLPVSPPAPRARSARTVQNDKKTQMQRKPATSTVTSGGLRVVSNKVLLSSPPLEKLETIHTPEECILPDNDISYDCFDLTNIQHDENFTSPSKNINSPSSTAVSIESLESHNIDTTTSSKDNNENVKMVVSRTVRRIIVPQTDNGENISNKNMTQTSDPFYVSPNSSQTKKPSALVVLFPNRAHSPLLSFNENCEHDMIDRNIKVDKHWSGKQTICTICGHSFTIRDSEYACSTTDEDCSDLDDDRSLSLPFDKLNINTTYFNDDNDDDDIDNNIEDCVFLWAKTEYTDERNDLQSLFTSDYSLEAGHQFTCMKCSIILTSRRFIIQHIIDVHDENSKLCYVCGVLLTFSHLMAHHFANKHSKRG